MIEGLPESATDETNTAIPSSWLSLTILISVSVVMLEVLSAGVGLAETMSSTQALLAKNEAALYQSKASDQWNFYEAKAVKRSIAELGVTMAPPNFSPEDLQKLKDNIQRYRNDEDQVSADAKTLEAKAEDANQQSAAFMEKHHHLALGGGILHLSVAITSIALIVRHRWFWHGGLILGAAGFAVALWAVLI